jgi:hypothetical protein
MKPLKIFCLLIFCFAITFSRYYLIYSFKFREFTAAVELKQVAQQESEKAR